MIRSDKEKNKLKVIKEVAENPMASEREIAKKVWISPSTAHEHIKDLPNSSKSEHIEKMLEKDLNIVDLAQKELERRLKDQAQDISTRDIIASADVSAKRYSLFKWDATDKDWGMKQDISDKQLSSISSVLSKLWKN